MYVRIQSRVIFFEFFFIPVSVQLRLVSSLSWMLSLSVIVTRESLRMISMVNVSLKGGRYIVIATASTGLKIRKLVLVFSFSSFPFLCKEGTLAFHVVSPGMKVGRPSWPTVASQINGCYFSVRMQREDSMITCYCQQYTAK
jgi:hypothetical protein